MTGEMCGTSFSKSAVSEFCKSLDTYVDEFRNRLLTGSYPFLTADAAYFKVSENHRVTSRACLQTSYRSQISEAARHTKAAKTSASLS